MNAEGLALALVVAPIRVAENCAVAQLAAAEIIARTAPVLTNQVVARVTILREHVGKIREFYVSAVLGASPLGQA